MENPTAAEREHSRGKKENSYSTAVPDSAAAESGVEFATRDVLQCSFSAFCS